MCFGIKGGRREGTVLQYLGAALVVSSGVRRRGGGKKKIVIFFPISVMGGIGALPIFSTHMYYCTASSCTVCFSRKYAV